MTAALQALAAVFKILGFLDWAEALLKAAQDRSVGRQQQHTSDVEAQAKEDQDAQKIDAADERFTDSELDDKLRPK